MVKYRGREADKEAANGKNETRGGGIRKRKGRRRGKRRR